MFDIFLLAFVGQLHQRIQTFLINQDSQFSYGIVLPDKRLCFCHLRLIQTMKIIAQKESVNICGNAGPENLTKDHRLLSSSGHTEPTSYFVKEFNEAKSFQSTHRRGHRFLPVFMLKSHSKPTGKGKYFGQMPPPTPPPGWEKISFSKKQGR